MTILIDGAIHKETRMNNAGIINLGVRKHEYRT